MKNLLRLEETAMFALAVFLNNQLPYPGWWYWALFLTPDIGMLGYVISTRTGAVTYNTMHHKGIAIGLYVAGIFFNVVPLEFTGLLLFGHSSFDRVFGYGLKYEDQFKHTHLGWIGQSAK